MPPPRSIALGDREITRIGLGTNRITDEPEVREFLAAAAESGLGMIDTAHLYTGGESERTIGAVLGADPGVPVATKGGYETGRPDELRAELERSLANLRTERIELYYLHRVDPDVPLEESLGVIREGVVAGRIARAGVSAVSVEQIERARGVVEIAAVQNEYNLGSREHDDVVDYCEANAIAFVPYYPLRGAEGAPGIAEVAAAHDATATQIALAWLLHRSPAIAPIPGTRSIEHLRENLAALEIELSADELERLAG